MPRADIERLLDRPRTAAATGPVAERQVLAGKGPKPQVGFREDLARPGATAAGWVAIVADCAAICKFGDMGKQPALEISQALLDVLWADPPPCDQILAAALDRLVAATHDVAEVDGLADFEPSPENDWRALYDEIGKRFPNYGYYTMASPMEANDQATFTADAVDDLADITRELRDVVWRGQTFGRDEAAWQFRFSYEIH